MLVQEYDSQADSGLPLVLRALQYLSFRLYISVSKEYSRATTFNGLKLDMVRFDLPVKTQNSYTCMRGFETDDVRRLALCLLGMQWTEIKKDDGSSMRVFIQRIAVRSNALCAQHFQISRCITLSQTDNSPWPHRRTCCGACMRQQKQVAWLKNCPAEPTPLKKRSMISPCILSRHAS